MKRLILLVALLAAPVAADPRQDIQAAYDQANAAAERLDSVGTLSACTDDRVAYGHNGTKVPLDAFRQHLKRIFAAAKSVHAMTKVTSLELQGNSAKVSVTDHFEVTGPNPRTGKISTLVVDNTAEDEWVLQGGAWRQRSSRSISETATLDGEKL